MRTTFILALAVMAALGLASAAGAQQQQPDRPPAAPFGDRVPLPPPPGVFGQIERSNMYGLLLRSDVQSEIHLSVTQRNALSEASNGNSQQLQQQFAQQLQAIQNLPPAQRRQRMRELQQMYQQQTAQSQGQLDQQVDKILKPAQIKRLHELDIQFRGPFALGDGAIAQEANLSSNTRAAVSQAIAEYQAKAQQMREETVEDLRNRGAFDRNRNSPQVDVERAMTSMQKKLEPLKRQAEENVLAALTPEEKERWTAIQGEKFTFRKDIQTRLRGR